MRIVVEREMKRKRPAPDPGAKNNNDADRRPAKRPRNKVFGPPRALLLLAAGALLRHLDAIGGSDKRISVMTYLSKLERDSPARAALTHCMPRQAQLLLWREYRLYYHGIDKGPALDHCIVAFGAVDAERKNHGWFSSNNEITLWYHGTRLLATGKFPTIDAATMMAWALKIPSPPMSRAVLAQRWKGHGRITPLRFAM